MELSGQAILLFNRLKTLWRERSAPISAIAVGLLTLALGFAQQRNEGGQARAAEAASAPEFGPIDTIIPEGFVLIPIDVRNVESLDSVAGQRALVDLFVKGPTGRSSLLLARVVLLRAPLNPRQFAVLVRAEDSAAVVSADSGVTVTLANPNDFRSPSARSSGPALAETHLDQAQAMKRARVRGTFKRVVYEDRMANGQD